MKASGCERFLCALAFLAAFGTLAGCAAEKEVAVFRYHEGVTPSDYYPLEMGCAWSYNVTVHAPDGQKQILSTTKVVGGDGADVWLRTGQNDFTYRVDEQGILKVQANYYLLRGPIRPDASWQLSLQGMDGTLKITDVHATVETPAGTFQECVVTEEVVPGLDNKVLTTFAPGVGVVKIEEFGMAGGQQIPLREAELMAFETAESKKSE